jgi:L-rhamnose mutarotase
MKSFSSFIISDSYLAERALDAELGDAADRFWALVSKDAVSLTESSLNLLGDYFQDGGGTFEKFNAIYPWAANLPTRLPEPKQAEWGEAVEGTLNRIVQVPEIQTKHEMPRMGGSNDFPTSLAIQLGPTHKYSVIPKSLKKDFERFSEQNRLLSVYLGGGAVGDRPDKNVGGFHYSLRHGTHSKIVVGGVTSLLKANMTNIVYAIYRLRLNRNKRKAEVAKWIEGFRADLRNESKVGIHEYIHLLDSIRYKTSITTEPRGLDSGRKAFWADKEEERSVYYKSDHEWQAYFQDTATRLRRNLRSFLDAMVNKGVVRHIIDNRIGGTGEKDRIDKWNGWNEHVRGAGFDASKRGAAIAAFIDEELTRIISSLGNEAEWKFGFKISYTINLTNLRNNRFTELAYAYMDKNSSIAMRYLKDDEMCKRYLKRIASLADDLRSITDDFFAQLKSGKSPSKQRWNQAMEDVYNQRYLYVGSLMRSKATDVYDVQHFFNQYEGI